MEAPGSRAIARTTLRSRPGGHHSRSWIDQLDENTLLGWPDLEVEVSEEVHSYESVDVLVTEGNTVTAKAGVVTPSTVNSAT